MKEVQLAYIAGLIDGEGTITLSHDSNPKYRTPVISLTNTSPEIIELLRTSFGGSVRTQKTYKEHHRKAWIWSIRYNRAIDALAVLRPYLVHPDKVYRADLILKEYKKVTKRNGQYSVVEHKAKIDFETRFFHPSTP